MKVTDKYVFFWNGIYSNWHPCEFTHNGIQFNCSEQAMMYAKAMLFGDVETAQDILNSNNPAEQKKLGRQVKNFDPVVWDEKCIDIVTDILIDKFEQNPTLKDMILYHGNYRHFVEASPYDTIWGVGMKEDDLKILNPDNWKGKNYLGICLDNVYNHLIN